MPIPVKFYSMSAEQFEKVLEKMKEKEEETEQEKREREELQGGIFFIDGTNEIQKT